MVMSKSVDSHLEVAQRLLTNVDADTCDLADAPMKVPASSYRDAARWNQEMEHVFRRSPLAMAEERRLLYARVVADEDYSTGIRITRALDALGDDHFRFGRNEAGNQHVHRAIDQLVGSGSAGS